MHQRLCVNPEGFRRFLPEVREGLRQRVSGRQDRQIHLPRAFNEHLIANAFGHQSGRRRRPASRVRLSMPAFANGTPQRAEDEQIQSAFSWTMKRHLRLPGPAVRSRHHALLTISWCREGDLNPHNPFGSADFKSAASASSATPAWCEAAVKAV